MKELYEEIRKELEELGFPIPRTVFRNKKHAALANKIYKATSFLDYLGKGMWMLRMAYIMEGVQKPPKCRICGGFVHSYNTVADYSHPYTAQLAKTCSMECGNELKKKISKESNFPYPDSSMALPLKVCIEQFDELANGSDKNHLKRSLITHFKIDQDTNNPKKIPIGLLKEMIDRGLNEVPMCAHCGKNKVTFSNSTLSTFCSNICAGKSEDTKRKREQTNLERYGHAHSLQNKEVVEKMKKTNLERYGHATPVHSEEIKKKIKKKNLELFGVEHTLQRKEIIEKIERTNLERYGHTNPNQSMEIKEKIKQTCKEKYGNEYFFTSEEGREKIKTSIESKYGSFSDMVKATVEKRKETNMVRYGVDNHARANVSEEVLDILNNKEKLQELYDEHKFMIKVAEHLGVHFSSVQRACTSLGVEINPRHKKSMIEMELCDFVESLGVEVTSSRRDILPSKLECDIVVDSHKLVIEMNGVHWHSNKFKDKDYHQKKSFEAHSVGYDLIHVWEDDWKDESKNNIVKSKIKAKLGLGDRRIYARKCAIVEPTVSEQMKFMEENHIQGYVNNTNCFGLSYDNELIALVGIKKTKDEGVYDLNRFCSSASVVGGFSKLLKHISRLDEVKKIFTFAHLDYSHGDLYRKTGFKEVHITPPNLWYFKRGEKIPRRLRREKFMKHKLPDLFGEIDLNKTEWQIMEENGFCRLFDAGSIKFEMEV